MRHRAHAHAPGEPIAVLARSDGGELGRAARVAREVLAHIDAGTAHVLGVNVSGGEPAKPRRDSKHWQQSVAERETERERERERKTEREREREREKERKREYKQLIARTWSRLDTTTLLRCGSPTSR
jgi:hypothetical protein